MYKSAFILAILTLANCSGQAEQAGQPADHADYVVIGKSVNPSPLRRIDRTAGHGLYYPGWFWCSVVAVPCPIHSGFNKLRKILRKISRCDRLG